MGDFSFMRRISYVHQSQENDERRKLKNITFAIYLLVIAQKQFKKRSPKSTSLLGALLKKFPFFSSLYEKSYSIVFRILDLSLFQNASNIWNTLMNMETGNGKICQVMFFCIKLMLQYRLMLNIVLEW